MLRMRYAKPNSNDRIVAVTRPPADNIFRAEPCLDPPDCTALGESICIAYSTPIFIVMFMMSCGVVT